MKEWSFPRNFAQALQLWLFLLFLNCLFRPILFPLFLWKNDCSLGTTSSLWAGRVPTFFNRLLFSFQFRSFPCKNNLVPGTTPFPRIRIYAPESAQLFTLLVKGEGLMLQVPALPFVILEEEKDSCISVSSHVYYTGEGFMYQYQPTFTIQEKDLCTSISP